MTQFLEKVMWISTQLNRWMSRFSVSLTLFSALSLVPAPVPAVDKAAVVSAVQAAREWRQASESELLERYLSLLRLPNFGGNERDIRRNAEHIVALFHEFDIPARVLEAPPSNPAVYAELTSPGAGRTVTFYVHYDGQPTSDDEWATPPFEPVLRSGKLEDGAAVLDFSQLAPPYDPDWRIYARSTSDDKAPLIGLLAAIQALREAGISRGVNLKFFFEGEEEIGSPNLRHMVNTHRELLRSDLWLFLDGPVHQSGRQSLSFGVRGVTGVDITVYGPNRGLHSGHYGNFAPNPIARLAHLLASMRDADGRILIDGFADEVIEPSAAELSLLSHNPDQDAFLIAGLGIAQAEMPAERYEQTLLRPALNMKGIRAGEVGSQARNVIVPSATASIGFRLVPAQSIAHIRAVFEQHLRAQGYHVVEQAPSAPERQKYPQLVRVQWELAGYPAVRSSLDLPVTRQLIQVMNLLTDGELALAPSLGGSLPLAHITQTLDVPIALLPIANHDNNQHAPDENIRLGHLWRGIETYAAVIANLALSDE